jgi:SAM-dependent methyltransferase
MAFSIHSFFRVISPLFRRRRMRQFLTFLRPAPDATILDVGGGYGTWVDADLRCRVTVLNLYEIPARRFSSGPDIETVVGDGCKLEFGDRSFDIVFSNSVIEHVGTFERQRAFARECRRTGRQLWVQTPARCFPIEPHLLTPFFHFFPRFVQRRLLRNFTVWGLVARPTAAEVEAFLSEVRLLTYREMRELFPDCEIIREKVMGFTKSYIALRK